MSFQESELLVPILYKSGLPILFSNNNQNKKPVLTIETR